MPKIPLTELERMNSDLDLFMKSPPVDPKLLKQDLYPPLPVCRNTMVWGFHFLRAAAERNYQELNCRRVAESTAQDLVELALRLENRAGKYSWEEKEALWSHLRREEIVEPSPELLRLIEGRQDPAWSDKIESYARLKQPLKQLVETGKVDLKTARLVCSLPDTVVEQIAGDTALSFSRRRSLLTDLVETARKQHWDPETIQSTLKRALQQKDPLQEVRRLRYPTLSSLEERFDRIRRELTQDSGVHLEPPPYFEGEAYHVHFSFNNDKTLSRKIEVLNRLQKHGHELYELLF